MRRFLFLAVLALCGCQTSQARLHTANVIASSAGLQKRDISAAPFSLRAYERVRDPASGTIRIYIEGDGLAWLDRATPSPDPTPVRPTGLLLASADDGANVVYIARPCQFNPRLLNGAACPMRYWTNERFSPDVVSAMNAAITDIAGRYQARRIELVGYSGGAALVLLVAARRGDIANIRTVAGNLDTDLFSELHHVSPLTRLAQSARGRKAAGIDTPIAFHRRRRSSRAGNFGRKLQRCVRSISLRKKYTYRRHFARRTMAVAVEASLKTEL